MTLQELEILVRTLGLRSEDLAFGSSFSEILARQSILYGSTDPMVNPHQACE